MHACVLPSTLLALIGTALVTLIALAQKTVSFPTDDGGVIFADLYGNVFADMGLPDAIELDAKARLGAAINRIVERRGLTQAEVAMALEINQPKVSALLHYKLEGFSVERLMRFLVALGQDVEIVVKAKPRTRSARIGVSAA
jgi:predicted XRE-type DNA-binding protein